MGEERGDRKTPCLLFHQLPRWVPRANPQTVPEMRTTPKGACQVLGGSGPLADQDRFCFGIECRGKESQLRSPAAMG